MPETTADGRPVDLDGLTIATPGMSARVEPVEVTPTREGVAADDRRGDPWEARFRSQGIVTTTAATINELSGALASPEYLITVQPPDTDHGQFIMYTDEHGLSTFHIAEGDGTTAVGGEGIAGSLPRTYIIPARLGPGPNAPQGVWGGAILRKVVRVLTFPLGKAVGRTAAWIWESKNRRQYLRTFTPTNYQDPSTTAPALDSFHGERALLMIHGTFSQAHTGFRGFEVVRSYAAVVPHRN